MARKKKAFKDLKLSTQLNYLYKAKNKLLENRLELQSKLMNLDYGTTGKLYEQEVGSINIILYSHIINLNFNITCSLIT